ncbi:MAG: hypothetical protein EBR82_29320 [Caulobacteraceae bacterium]|nr:hypothetical protein [Caulobacteraceae bacterium]
MIREHSTDATPRKGGERKGKERKGRERKRARSPNLKFQLLKKIKNPYCPPLMTSGQRPRLMTSPVILKKWFQQFGNGAATISFGSSAHGATSAGTIQPPTARSTTRLPSSRLTGWLATTRPRHGDLPKPRLSFSASIFPSGLPMQKPTTSPVSPPAPLFPAAASLIGNCPQ